MLTKTVTGRKCLNAMLRHLAFHGHIEVPCQYRQRLEYAIVKQLHIDGKVTTSRNGYGEYIIVLRDGTLYNEQVSDSVEPLVVYLALQNPKVEHLAKVYRANYTVPVLPDYVEADPNEIFTDLD